MRSVAEWKESRRLTSQRAGAVSQRFASQRLDRYMRSHVPFIIISLAGVLCIAAVEWLILSSRPGFQGFATGLTVGVGISILYHWLVVSSGAAASVMGQAVEEWTDSELQRLRRKGWRHVNHLMIKSTSGDVDHVAVGPDGVLVIETKWRSAEVNVDNLSHWTHDAVNQARQNRDDVRRFLGWRERDRRPVEALVVWWGPEVTHESTEAVLANDVNVMAGEHLSDELDALSDVRLSPEEIDEIYAKLKTRVEKVDENESKIAEPATPTLQERANRWVRNAVAAYAGLLLATLSFNLGWWALAAIGSLTVAGIAVRRIEALRSEASWFVGGVLITLPLILVAALWSL